MMSRRWAAGIMPRNFSWISTCQLAICERPGGYGANHPKEPGRESDQRVL